MANVRISLSDDSSINKVNVYSDVDVNTSYMENTLKDRRAIENSINNILTWRNRERIMNPGFGNSLWKRIFENFSSFTISDIKNEVSKILSSEPRIKIKTIDVSTDINNDEIYIHFTYIIPELDNASNGENVSEYSLTISNA